MEGGFSSEAEGTDRDCSIGKSLAVGESRSVDVRVLVTDGNGYFTGGVAMDANYDQTTRSATEDPNYANQSASFTWGQPRAASSLTLRIGRKTAKLDAIGALRPAHRGEKVLVKLTRNGKLVAKKNVTLAINSVYAISFKRPRSGTCKVIVTFAGDPDHLPSSKTKGFRC
jgi:hypothetical protein